MVIGCRLNRAYFPWISLRSYSLTELIVLYSLLLCGEQQKNLKSIFAQIMLLQQSTLFSWMSGFA